MGSVDLETPLRRKEKFKYLAAGTMLATMAVTTADTVAAPRSEHRPVASGTTASAPADAREEAANPPIQPGVPVGSPHGRTGLPETAFRAYRLAEQQLAQSRPGCHLSWSLVAAIGRVESNHARQGQVDASGTTLQPIFGPQLSGGGYASIRDTDNGELDSDTEWDRAVGPMQFVPTTWRRNGVDANADGVASPHNLFDATVTAGHYLCAHNRDLANPAHLADAVYSYNPSQSYVDIVLAWQRTYAAGMSVVPDTTGSYDPRDALAPPSGPLQPARPVGPITAPPRQPPATTPATPPPPSADEPDPGAPPTAECLVDLAELGIDTAGITTELACQEHLLRLGPVRVDIPAVLQGDTPQN